MDIATTQDKSILTTILISISLVSCSNYPCTSTTIDGKNIGSSLSAATNNWMLISFAFMALFGVALVVNGYLLYLYNVSNQVYDGKGGYVETNREVEKAVTAARIMI